MLDVVGLGATRSDLEGLDLPEVVAHGIQSLLGVPEERRDLLAEVIALVSGRIVLDATIHLHFIV